MRRAFPQILIADNNTLAAMDIRKKFSNLGLHDVRLARTSDQALAVAEKVPPDLALLDVLLNGSLDGLQVGRRLRSRYSTSLLFLSAYPEARILAREPGARTHRSLTKPVSTGDLARELRKALFEVVPSCGQTQDKAVTSCRKRSDTDATECLQETDHSGIGEDNDEEVTLIIDDDPLVMDVLCDSLALHGIRAVGFTRPDKALRWYRANIGRVCTIVLDLQMPRMDGLSCYYRLKAMDSTATIIFFTANPTAYGADSLLARGDVVHYRKPGDVERLIEHLLEHSESDNRDIAVS